MRGITVPLSRKRYLFLNAWTVRKLGLRIYRIPACRCSNCGGIVLHVAKLEFYAALRTHAPSGKHRAV